MSGPIGYPIQKKTPNPSISIFPPIQEAGRKNANCKPFHFHLKQKRESPWRRSVCEVMDEKQKHQPLLIRGVGACVFFFNFDSSCGLKENGMPLYPVSLYYSGEGLPYAPEDWPYPGDK
ncbi:Hypothetical predicted protein [Olea europaea subsp. europaea]|uniref:DUF7081 domain-containing protein n=1 Tax=Olea europaea subsp. europaea TaxID=158383 RepID=A0A8S0S188_OLEEU|nr:Hypothetical predicted protein [Olea europaea subsp. europaea]